MRVIYTSDLHYPITSEEDIVSCAQKINDSKPDAIVLGGDLGESRVDPQCFADVLKIFSDECSAPLLVIIGNHDLWVNDETDYNSKDLFDLYLPSMTREHGATWLESENYVIGDVAIVGSYLHYDYSAKDTVGACAGLSDQYYEHNKSSVNNNDGRFIVGINDKEFALFLGNRFQSRLLEAQNDERINSIIVATHVPCLERQITRRPYDYFWSIKTPYFGNLSCEKTIKSCNKVKFVVSGHSHCDIDPDGSLQAEGVYVCPSDYKAPAFVIMDV